MELSYPRENWRNEFHFHSPIFPLPGDINNVVRDRRKWQIFSDCLSDGPEFVCQIASLIFDRKTLLHQLSWLLPVLYLSYWSVIIIGRGAGLEGPTVGTSLKTKWGAPMKHVNVHVCSFRKHRVECICDTRGGYFAVFMLPRIEDP